MSRHVALLLVCLGTAASGRLAASTFTVTPSDTRSPTPTSSWSPSSTPGTPSPTLTPTQTPVATAVACSLATNQAADFSLGQPDLFSGLPNAGITRSAQTLAQPDGLAVVGPYLFVTEFNDNRVLGYLRSTLGQAASASVLLGQSNFGSFNSSTITTASGFAGPADVASDGQILAIADTNNNRVLIYGSIPSGVGAVPDFVLGQATMLGGAANSGAPAQCMSHPQGVAVADGKVFVSDSSNNRVLIYSLPLTNGQAASLVLGQADFNSMAADRGGPVSAGGLDAPAHICVANHHLFVQDTANRILVWNDDLSLVTGQSADLVVGQPNLNSSTGFGPTASTFDDLTGVYSDGTKLFVSDFSRILIFDSLPTSNGASADQVLGRANFVTGFTTTESITAQTIAVAQGVASDGTYLFVAANAQNRVLAFGCAAPSITASPTSSSTTSPTPSSTPTPAPPTATPAPTPALSPVPTSLIANFNGGITDVANGGNVQMQFSAANSSISQSAGPSSSLSGGTGSSLHLTGSIGKDDGTGPFAVAQISIFNGWTWAYIPPAAPDHALTFSYQADAISVGQQLRVSFQTGTDGFYTYVFTPSDTAWHQVTVYFPDVSGPSFTPQFVASAGTPAWSVGVFDIRSINFDIVASASAAQSFGFSVDDIHLGEPQSNNSPVQIATALGVTAAQVSDAYSYGLDEQLTWIVLLLAKDCGCSPDQIMTDRQTNSWGGVAVAVGTTWPAVLAQLATASAGLNPPIQSMADGDRSLINGPLPTPGPVAQFYVPASGFVVPTPTGSCP